jgi:MFS superfamily sulfate permease-like transporter
MSTEPEKNELQVQLNRQHLHEWNAHLDLEIQVRDALLKKHQQENIRLHLEEINFHERTMLVTRQAQELDELKHQDRETRIATQKRHAQEKTDLINQLG